MAVKKKDSRPKCYRCKFLCFQDTGYSDYTVTGQLVECLKNKFEEREKVWNQDEKAIAEEEGFLAASSKNCKQYSEGEPLESSVDQGENEREKRLLEK